LTRGKTLLDFQNLCPLKVSEFRRHPLQSGAQQSERIQEIRVSVAVDDLSGNRVWFQTKKVAYPTLEQWGGDSMDANGAADLSDSDLLSGFL
jgi:hypothetical protein